jgi:hypothetical protein
MDRITHRLVYAYLIYDDDESTDINSLIESLQIHRDKGATRVEVAIDGDPYHNTIHITSYADVLETDDEYNSRVEQQRKDDIQYEIERKEIDRQRKECERMVKERGWLPPCTSDKIRGLDESTGGTQGEAKDGQ